MSNIIDKPHSDDLTKPQAESDDPAYLAWRDAKVKKALDEAKANPGERISQQEIWKKFGLEH